MIPALALVGSIAALVSLAAPLVLIPLLVRLGAHDDATDRSSHSGRALRGLGLGVLAAFLAAMGVGLVQIPTSEIGITAIVTLAAAAVALIGLAEDVRGVGALGRFAAQSAVGALVGGSLVVVAGMPAWAVPLVALWFTAYVNFTNFMDGVDGISSSHGIVVGAAFTIAGALWLEPWLSFVGVAIAASFGGFLPWNLRRRGTFLGDTGSYLLGGSVAAATAVATLRDVPVVVVVAPLAIYLTDTVVTVIRRMAAAEPWLAPHRSHAYQRLTQRGLSHIAASTVVSAVSALCAVAGLIAGTLGPAWQWAGWVAIAGVAAAYLASPVLLGAPVPAATIREPPPSPLPAGAGIPERGRAIVVGASGFVGSHVARRLRDDGWEATAVAPPRLSLSPGSTSDDVRRAVLAHESAVIDLSQALGEVDVVVNAAGIAAPDSRRGASLTGANALLPAIIVAAAQRAGSRRFVHVSSAEVQGRRAVLDESAETAAFSPYTHSKALGESALLAAVAGADDSAPEVVIVRATAIQGPGRPITNRLRRFASSRLASIATAGDRPSPVSSIDGLSSFVSLVVRCPSDVPTIVLQPSEGLTNTEVLLLAGGRTPRRIPPAVGRVVIALGYLLGAVVTGVRVATYQLETVLFGRPHDAAWARSVGASGESHAEEILKGAT